MERSKSISYFYDVRFCSRLPSRWADDSWAACLQSHYNCSLRWSMAKIPGFHGWPLWPGSDERPFRLWMFIDPFRTTRGIFLGRYVSPLLNNLILHPFTLLVTQTTTACRFPLLLRRTWRLLVALEQPPLLSGTITSSPIASTLINLVCISLKSDKDI